MYNIGYMLTFIANLLYHTVLPFLKFKTFHNILILYICTLDFIFCLPSIAQNNSVFLSKTVGLLVCCLERVVMDILGWLESINQLERFDYADERNLGMLFCSVCNMYP